MIGMNETIAQTYRAYIPQLGVAMRFLQNGRALTSKVDVFNFSVFFTDRNCSGDPFTSESGWRHGVTKPANTQRYFKFTGNLPITRRAISGIDNNGGCGAVDFDVTPSFLLQEITLPFTEPLAWPLSIKVR